MHRTNFGTVGMALTVALFSLACDGRDNDDVAVDDTAAAMAERATGATATAGGDVANPTGAIRIGEINDNLDRYIGDTVTVEADIEEVLSAFAFALDEDDALAGGIDNDLLVFGPQSAQLANIDDQWLNNRVRVTGTVHRMTVAQLERELGRDLDPNLESKVEGSRPVLIAHSVNRVNR